MPISLGRVHKEDNHIIQRLATVYLSLCLTLGALQGDLLSALPDLPLDSSHTEATEVINKEEIHEHRSH